MLYREMSKTGDKISILGYGCMRFPKKGRAIDEAEDSHQLWFTGYPAGVEYTGRRKNGVTFTLRHSSKSDSILFYEGLPLGKVLFSYIT